VTPTNTRASALQPYGLTLLRIVIGIVFFAHGYMKVFKMGIGGTTGFFTHLGIPLPTLMASLVSLAETVGALALILGIFTPYVGAALAIDMLGAIYFAKGITSGLLAPKGYELELTLFAAAVAVALTGPGALALGNLIGRRRLTS
jgi:putative oxidoreductase